MVGRVLNVAEKPSVAKEISNILSEGRCTRRNGKSPYNVNWEFDYDLNGAQVRMIFTSVTGHLCSTDFPDEYRAWTSCDPSALFSLPVRKFIPEDKAKLKENLQTEARSCQRLVLWLDCDREGENICFEVQDCCRGTNPRLQVLRARFSALIPRDIFHATRNLVEPSQRLSDAVDARQEIDLRLGAIFTRFQTLRLQRKFGGLSEGVISYGPCQFPTLGFVVDRYWRIQAFTSEPFWKIECEHTKRSHGSEDSNNKRNAASKCSFTWARGHLFDHLACLVLFELCVEHPTATVVKVDGKEKRRYRVPPLATVELQKRVATKLRISSERTMHIAEELYTEGFI
mmetsp:Transcript_20434/g.34055  ORF Transcript_20434/g.34055 Transcript_20434/m.34055 type:complete len:342 (-) Transcript_20434:14-1039(-)